MDPGTVRILIGTLVLMVVILTIALGKASFTDKRIRVYFKLVVFTPLVAISGLLLWFRVIPKLLEIPVSAGGGSAGFAYIIGALLTVGPTLLMIVGSAFDEAGM
jgi:hypothetical protein